VKRNNLVAVTVVLALYVLLGKFSGVRTTFISEVIMKTHKLLSREGVRSVFTWLGLATLDLSSVWMERTSCPKVMTGSQVL